MKAQYTFFVYNFGKYHPHTVTVTIVDQTEKRFKIRIPCRIGKHAPGDTMWVQKRKCRLNDDTPTAPAKTTHATKHYDYTNAYWNQ